ncbi:MAG: OmpA family protein, partial [Acidobacteriota bacterium]
MGRNLPGLLLIAVLSGPLLLAQGLDTRQRATDWEEINFEFNQSVIVDGFPGMLRLADLLKQHPDYKVVLTGNADQIGSARYNQTLSLKRAEAVSQFLQHYGAAANQITVKGDGKTSPEATGRGVNPRFMNRRVVINVTAPDGTQIGDGTLTSAILDFIKSANAQLSKIDSILAQLHDLENEVKALQGDTGAIKQTTAAIQESTTAIKQ